MSKGQNNMFLEEMKRKINRSRPKTPLAMGKVIVLEDTPVLNRMLFNLQLASIYHHSYRAFIIQLLIANSYCWISLGIMAYSMYTHINKMEDLATIAHHSILVIDVVGGHIIMLLHRAHMFRIAEGMKLSHDYQSKIVSEFRSDLEEKRVRKLTQIYKAIMISATYMMSNLIANAYIETKIMGTKHMLIFPSWFPLDIDYIWNHVLMYVWQLVLLIQVTVMAFGLMTFLYLAYSHITTEFTILEFATEKITERTEEFVREEGHSESAAVLRKGYINSVNHCARHHVEIVKYFQDLQETTSVIYFLIFLTGIVICICMGLALLSDNTVIKVKFLGIALVQLVILFTVCWFGEAIGEKSQNIRLVIYETPWYEMPKDCQITLMLMVERTLKPLSLTSAFGHKADLDTYMSIVKASYSYFNMILAAQE